jgi:hypothetical protein
VENPKQCAFDFEARLSLVSQQVEPTRQQQLGYRQPLHDEFIVNAGLLAVSRQGTLERLVS